VEAEAAQRATCCRRRRFCASDARWRVAAGVLRGRAPAGAAVLAVVDVVEARPVAAAHVERAVGAEAKSSERMTRELLAPAAQEHLLAARHRVARRGQPGQPTGDDAAVG